MSSKKVFNKTGFLVKEQVIKSCRQFFDELGMHEVISPVLNTSIPLEPTIHPFTTTWFGTNPPTTCFMSASPERGMKLLLAQGLGQAYSIGKSFRNLEGKGTRHNPEFLMLEWYREQSSYTQIMKDVEALVRSVAKVVSKKVTEGKIQRLGKLTEDTLEYQDNIFDISKPWPVVSLNEQLKKYAGFEIQEVLEDEEMRRVAAQKGYYVGDSTWEELFDQIIVNEVEPHFSMEPFFLIDFPARLSPLCQPRQDYPYLAERFEAFMGGIEIGNGNTEHTNAAAVRDHFEKEAKDRQMAMEQGKVVHTAIPPLDIEFLDALTNIAGKGYAGMGLGIDRVVMMMANASSIDEVEYFRL
jgi:elongation factor P--beta-lysine ligase